MNYIKSFQRNRGVRRLKTTSFEEESWVIITGCTSGIGKAYTEILAANGFKLILFLRNKEKLKSLNLPLESASIKIYKCDFTKDELYTNEKFNEYLKEFRELNIKLLINNVGQSSELGNFYNFDINRHKSMINVNINSHIFMTQLFILSQKDKPGQHGIINISSYYGTRAVPGVAIYSACKIFLTTFSQCTDYETNMKVLTLNPLFIKTNMVRLKESFFVIKPEDLVYSSFNKLGKSTSYGNYRHIILAWLFNLIPNKLFCRMSLKYYRDLYNKLKRK
jgi:17beta-estradiol 17-dehydrogenase / very-long-chain 3-oxoacyl-CoA reductase